jgi:hypothetical protein
MTKILLRPIASSLLRHAQNKLGGRYCSKDVNNNATIQQFIMLNDKKMLNDSLYKGGCHEEKHFAFTIGLKPAMLLLLQILRTFNPNYYP